MTTMAEHVSDVAFMNQSLYEKLRKEFTDRYGPMIGGADLRRVLGYKSPDGFRLAIIRNQLGVATFVVPHRKGHFALSDDVAKWLAELRSTAANQPDEA